MGRTSYILGCLTLPSLATRIPTKLFPRGSFMKIVSALLLLSVSFAVAAIADDHDKDHHHHEGLTEAQLGTVHFPVSCAESVQKPFARGVALLHSFWYEEAEKEFLGIAKDDPNCAMAHWGVAMSLWHQLWDHPDEKVIKRGLKEVKTGNKLAKKSTPREQAYLAAAAAFYSNSKNLKHDARAKAYSDAMKKVYDSYPDDHEAAAFYALSLIASEPDDDKDFATRKQAAAVLEKVFAAEPDHPGVVHYLILTYDRPELAQLGIPAARRYAEIAPAAPHALHMPSHIFARVGLWQDDINSNLASIDATRKTAAMGMGGEGHQFHAMDFLVYAYLQTGREAAAQKVIEDVKAMPSHHMDGMKYDERLESQVRFEASYVLELHQWRDAASLPFVSTDPEYNDVTYLARALGAARSGQLAEARKDIDAVKGYAKSAREKKRTGLADFLDRNAGEALAWIAHSEGKDDEAINLLRTVAEKETDGFSETGFLPAQELLGDLLLDAKRPQEALIEYQTDLKLNPNRFNSLYGAARAAEDAGKQNDANGYYASLLKSCAGSTSTRPELNHARELLAQK